MHNPQRSREIEVVYLFHGGLLAGLCNMQIVSRASAAVEFIVLQVQHL